MNPVLSSSLADQIISGFQNILPKIPLAIFVFAIGFVVIRLLLWASQFLIGLVRMPKGLKGIIVSLVDVLLWAFLIIVTLQTLGLDKLALVFSGAVAALGLAVGAGASTVAADILSGIFLARDQDFSVGDVLSVGETPVEGVVESMDMRRVRVRTDDGKLHVIPNSVVERKQWIVIEKRRDRVQRLKEKESAASK